MKVKQWLVIGKRGISRAVLKKPALDWNEIAMQVELDIPDALFIRPHLQATIQVKDVPPTTHDAKIVIDTKELIEQQTGAKIDFKIIRDEDAE